jgi:dihydroorotate dehydrogenase/NAD-dependent dihydropyrimidine dehydrogenase PreA subunit
MVTWMTQPDLSIEIAGIKHDPAIWIGAGPCTARLSTMKRCIKAGAGAVDTKRTALPGLERTQQGPHTRPIRKPGRTKSPYRWLFAQNTRVSSKFGYTGPLFYSLHHCEPNFLHFETAQNLIRGMKAWRPDVPVYQNSCASKYMPGDNVDNWIKIGRAGQEAGADAYVMDFWVSGHFPMGFTVGKWADTIFKPVVEALDIPVFYKMLPSFDYNQIREVCRALEKVGVQALQPTEGPVLLPPCDIENDGKPVLNVTEKHSVRTLVCGPWLKWIANTMVYLASESVKIPVMGIGGIMDARDAIERIMYGASAIGLCTAPLIKGYGVIQEIKDGIAKFMKDHRYDSIEDFRGIAKKHVVWDMYTEMELVPCAPDVNPSLCDGCGICVLPVHCDAMRIEDDVAVCEVEECMGCGICAQLCPQNAIQMKKQ